MSILAEPLSPSLQIEPDPIQIPMAPTQHAAVIVAHPDDETLWSGGTILTHPNYQWFVTALCRKSDPDRSKKFFQALHRYDATGAMADLDDGVDQIPLPNKNVQKTILELLPEVSYDLILTHAPNGEYTTHRRHEEVSKAVIDLWLAGTISSKELWMFAYSDDHGQHLPKPIETAHRYETYPEAILQEKYRIITKVYGFDPGSWEVRAIPQSEAFWSFENPAALISWLARNEAQS